MTVLDHVFGHLRCCTFSHPLTFYSSSSSIHGELNCTLFRRFWGSEIEYARTGVDIRLGGTIERDQDGPGTGRGTPIGRKGRKGRKGDSVTNAGAGLIGTNGAGGGDGAVAGTEIGNQSGVAIEGISGAGPSRPRSDSVAAAVEPTQEAVS